MRIGIISDIHGNLEAMQTVLATLSRLKVDRYVCLGDLVGYGACPDEVVTLVRPMVDFSIMGNHDAAVVGKMDYSYYYEAAKDALDWTVQQLSKENFAWLAEQPYIMLEDEICFVHGEPIQPDVFAYLYTQQHARKLVPHYRMMKPITFVGHSHLRRVFEYNENGVLELPDENFTLRPDRKYAVAIGSVGQPRDYDPRSSFVIYDAEQRRVEFYRVAYDVDAAVNRIMNAGLPEYFATRLYSGS